MYPLHRQFYHKPMAKSIDDGKMKSARIFAFVGVADDLQEEQISSRREFSANAFPLCTFFFEKKVRKKAIRGSTPLGEACKGAPHACISPLSRRSLQGCSARLHIPPSRRRLQGCSARLHIPPSRRRLQGCSARLHIPPSRRRLQGRSARLHIPQSERLKRKAQTNY